MKKVEDFKKGTLRIRNIPDAIYITKCSLSTNPADVFDNVSDDPKLIEEIDKFLKDRDDLVVQERRKNCVLTNLNFYIALYGKDFDGLTL